MKKHHILLCILFVVVMLLTSCGQADDASSALSDNINTKNSDIEDSIISAIGSKSELQEILLAIDEEKTAELSASKVLADAIGNKIQEYINSGAYGEFVDLLDLLAGQEIKNNELLLNINDIIKQLLMDSSDEDILKLAYALQMSNRGTNFYYEQYDKLIKQRIMEIIEDSEVPISKAEARWDIYPVEDTAGHEITRYGDFTVSKWGFTKTEDSSSGKLYIKTDFVNNNSAAVYCKGTIKNNSESTYYFVRIRAAFLNGAGEVIDTGWTYGIGSEGLEPEESTEFTIYGDRPHSTVRGCRITALEISESEYVTSDTIIINSETEEYYKLMFHHVNLGDSGIDNISDTYH